ncbi:MAG TPA: hypothetical protein VGK02_01640 [Candidatus Aquicultor sp.]|jgi:hypothetical protein
MIARLLVLVALISSCFISTAYAASNNTNTLFTAQQFESPKLESSSLTSSFKSSSLNSNFEESDTIVRNSLTGLHGRYVTTPSRCRVCHGFDKRAQGIQITAIAGIYACDWCHDFGAASSYYVTLEGDEFGKPELGVGHSRGYGLSTGKWSAPDDTYPAFIPRFWYGGLSCFDCHSPHANPSRILGFNKSGQPRFGVLDPGFTDLKTSSQPGSSSMYKSGRWILKKNPDPEIDPESGYEIADTYDGDLSSLVRYPVNKVAINWDNPYAKNVAEASDANIRLEKTSSVSELCIDCHDGDGGLHSTSALAYSPENGADGKTGLNSYERAFGHDSQPGKCSGKLFINTEDGKNNGPPCRSCHRAGGDCDLCHTSGRVAAETNWPRDAYAPNPSLASNKGFEGVQADKVQHVLDRDSLQLKSVARWDPQRKNSSVECSSECVNLGYSWPHRTFAWKMLKNELYGVYLDDQNVEVTQVKQLLVKYSAISAQPAQDPIGAVCLDCHNPFVWKPGTKEALKKGLP